MSYIVAVAAPVGGGKSTLVQGVAGRLADAAVIQFDHYERITAEPIEKIMHWMRNGADVDDMVIPGLAEALQSLKRGSPVIDPLTRAEIPARKYILFETQFGRQHRATGRYIDLMVWIETPPEVALARKIRQFAGELRAAASRDEIDAFAPWLHTYLDNYLGVVRELLRIQRDTVGANADLTVGGEGDADALARQVEREIRRRLP